MSKAFRLFPEIDVADWYVPIEKVEKKEMLIEKCATEDIHLM